MPTAASVRLKSSGHWSRCVSNGGWALLPTSASESCSAVGQDKSVPPPWAIKLITVLEIRGLSHY